MFESPLQNCLTCTSWKVKWLGLHCERWGIVGAVRSEWLSWGSPCSMSPIPKFSVWILVYVQVWISSRCKTTISYDPVHLCVKKQYSGSRHGFAGARGKAESSIGRAAWRRGGDSCRVVGWVRTHWSISHLQWQVFPVLNQKISHKIQQRRRPDF